MPIGWVYNDLYIKLQEDTMGKHDDVWSSLVLVGDLVTNEILLRNVKKQNIKRSYY